MEKSRDTVEWILKEVKQFWTLLLYKRKLWIGKGAVGDLYVAMVVLNNGRNLVYPNPISKYFGVINTPLDGDVDH